MTKQMKDRLNAAEEAGKDGQGSFLFVTNEADGRFYDAHTKRAYTAEQLQTLHNTRPDLIIINQGGPGSPALPVHPAGDSLGRTLDDIRLYNEITGKRYNEEPLTVEEEAYLAEWEAADAQVREAYETWKAESQPQFDEAIHQVELLNARPRSKSRGRQ